MFKSFAICNLILVYLNFAFIFYKNSMDINDEDYIDSCQKQSGIILDEIRKAN